MLSIIQNLTHNVICNFSLYVAIIAINFLINDNSINFIAFSRIELQIKFSFLWSSFKSISSLVSFGNSYSIVHSLKLYNKIILRALYCLICVSQTRTYGKYRNIEKLHI